MFEYKASLFIDSDKDFRMERLSACDCQHTHDFLELVFVEKGSMVQIIDNKPYRVSSGSLLIILPGQTHSFLSINLWEISYINIYIKMSLVEKLLDLKNKQSAPASAGENFYTLLEQNNAIIPIANLSEDAQRPNGLNIKDMLSLYNEKPQHYKQTLNDAIIKLFEFLNKEINASKAASPKNMQIIPEAILETLEKSFPNMDSCENAFASTLNYNKDYITRKFKNYCSLTIADYIQINKLHIAFHLLWQTDLSVDDICEQIGYRNKYYFYKIFKKYYDMTPGQLRSFYMKKLYGATPQK